MRDLGTSSSCHFSYLHPHSLSFSRKSLINQTIFVSFCTLHSLRIYHSTKYRLSFLELSSSSRQLLHKFPNNSIKMKYSTFFSAAAMASVASAHATLWEAIVDGVSGGSDGRGTYIRAPKINNPLKDLTSQDLRCNVGGGSAVAKTIDAKPGSTIVLEWHHDTDAASDDTIAAVSLSLTIFNIGLTIPSVSPRSNPYLPCTSLIQRCR